VVASLLALGAVAFIGLIAPSWVRREATRVLVERSALSVSIQSADVLHDGVVLRGLRFNGRERGVVATAAIARIHCAPWRWLWTGRSACRAVRVEGLAAVVDISAVGFAAWWAGRTLGRSGSSARGDEPLSFIAEQVDVRVRDAHDALVRIEGGRVVFRRGRWGASAQELMFGADDGEYWILRGVDIGALREAGEWRIGGIAVRNGRVVSASDADVPGLRSRLGSALAVLRSPRAPHPISVATSNSSTDDDWPIGWSRVSARAALWVANVDVAVRGADGEADSVRELSGAMVRGPGDVVRTWGSGRGVPDGALRWALEVRPGDLRGEGTVRMDDLPVGLLGPILPEFALKSAREARIDGELALRGDGYERLGLAGTLAVRGVVLDSARIAPSPIRGVTLAVSGRAAFLPARGRLEFEDTRVALGGDAHPVGTAVGVLAAGALEWTPAHFRVDAVMTLPTTPCDAAIAAIPRDLLAEVAGFRLAGTLAGRLRLLVDSRDLAATRVDVAVNDGCVFEDVPAFADLRRFASPFVQRVLEPDGSEFAFETGPGSGSWTPIAEMSPFLLHAVIAHEDAGFLSHHGFAPSEIQVALVRNLEAGRYVQGASTITMQLVKNVFLHREKTLARKVQEVLLTWWTESAFSKEQILELYLNVIEYGPSIYGIRHAAAHYFGREPGELSVAESAFLATILPSPKLFHAAYVDGRPSPRLRERLRAFLRRMESRGRIDATALETGLAEVDQMTFHREGADRPVARPLVGSARPLPFGLGSEVSSDWSDTVGDRTEGGEHVLPDAADATDETWSSSGE
jgi:hypothetical protein